MRRLIALAATASVVLVSPFVVWWVVGDLSETTDSNPDYMIRSPHLTSAQERSIGAAAMVAGVLALVVIVVAVRRRWLCSAELVAALPLVFVGAFLGLAGRVMTAAVIGANIGGGMVIFFGVAFVPAMIVSSVFGWRAARQRSGRA